MLTRQSVGDLIEKLIDESIIRNFYLDSHLKYLNKLSETKCVHVIRNSLKQRLESFVLKLLIHFTSQMSFILLYDVTRSVSV